MKKRMAALLAAALLLLGCRQAGSAASSDNTDFFIPNAFVRSFNNNLDAWLAALFSKSSEDELQKIKDAQALEFYNDTGDSMLYSNKGNTLILVVNDPVYDDDIPLSSEPAGSFSLMIPLETDESIRKLLQAVLGDLVSKQDDSIDMEETIDWIVATDENGALEWKELPFGIMGREKNEVSYHVIIASEAYVQSVIEAAPTPAPAAEQPPESDDIGMDAVEVDPAPKPDIPSGDYKALTKGDKGDDVKRMQEALINLGFLSGSADGSFGPKTASAVWEFCETNGITPSEIATPQMQALLFSSGAKPFQEPDVPLIIPSSSKGQYEKVSGDNIKLRVQVENVSRTKTIKAFELYAFCTDVWGNAIYGDATYYNATTTRTVEPGKTVYCDYIKLPNRSQISQVFIGIKKVVFADGSVRENSTVNYHGWNLK